MKKIIKSRIFYFILGAIIFSGVTAYAATKYKAKDVTYKNTTVEEALNDLYQNKTNSSDFANKAYWNYEYSGTEQEFIIPTNGKYKIELWGAQGGTGENGTGGKGAYTSGEIVMKKNDKIYIYVGNQPTLWSGICNLNGNSNNSFNGSLEGSCVGGGGATDIRLVKTNNWYDESSLISRIMVAAGGGGSYYNATSGYGGALIGGSSKGSGGTQVSSSFGIGTADTTVGGGGYFGGEGGNAGNAGGGSSYISGYKGCIAITSDSTLENIKQRNDSKNNICTTDSNDIVCSYHYSNKIFLNPVMKAGNEEMPTHDGKSNMTGNSGNGYAKITYLGN